MAQGLEGLAYCGVAAVAIPVIIIGGIGYVCWRSCGPKGCCWPICNDCCKGFENCCMECSQCCKDCNRNQGPSVPVTHKLQSVNSGDVGKKLTPPPCSQKMVEESVPLKRETTILISETWHCRACTFINSCQRTDCQLCSSPRMAPPPPSQPEGQRSSKWQPPNPNSPQKENLIENEKVKIKIETEKLQAELNELKQQLQQEIADQAESEERGQQAQAQYDADVKLATQLSLEEVEPGSAFKPQLDDSIACSRCTQSYDYKNHLPKLLSCGHTFCITCIQERIKLQNEGLTCSICQIQCKIPQNGVSGLVTNFAVLEIAKRLTELSTPSTLSSSSTTTTTTTTTSSSSSSSLYPVLSSSSATSSSSSSSSSSPSSSLYPILPRPSAPNE